MIFGAESARAAAPADSRHNAARPDVFMAVLLRSPMNARRKKTRIRYGRGATGRKEKMPSLRILTYLARWGRRSCCCTPPGRGLRSDHLRLSIACTRALSTAQDCAVISSSRRRPAETSLWSIRLGACYVWRARSGLGDVSAARHSLVRWIATA